MNQTPPRPTNVPQPENQENSEEGLEDNEESGSRFLLCNVMPSWLVSFLSHIAVIIILAVIIMPPQKDRVVALQAGEQAAQPLESFEMNFDTLDFNAEEAVEQEFSEQETTEVTEMVDTALPEAEVDFGNILGAEEVALESEMLGALEAADMSSETSSRSGNSKGQLNYPMVDGALITPWGRAISETAPIPVISHRHEALQPHWQFYPC